MNEGTMAIGVRLPFLNRREAGKLLSQRLAYLRTTSPIVVAIAPGGIEVAAEVAAALGAPLSAVVVESIETVRGHSVGAAAERGSAVVDAAQARAVGIRRAELEARAHIASSNARRLAARYDAHVSVAGRRVVLIDDGLCQGLVQIAAARAVRLRGATTVVLGTPVLAMETALEVSQELDRTVCLVNCLSSNHLGSCYLDSRQLSEREAIAMLSPEAARSGVRLGNHLIPSRGSS